MVKNSLSALVIGFAILSTSAFAGADKACLKKAKADYATAKGACKSSKGKEKKACEKTAKADYGTAKDACKAPAAEAAPAAPAPAEAAPAAPAE
jgi:hypothetical protein